MASFSLSIVFKLLNKGLQEILQFDCGSFYSIKEVMVRAEGGWFRAKVLVTVYAKIQYGDKTTTKYPSNHITLYYIKGGHRKKYLKINKKFNKQYPTQKELANEDNSRTTKKYHAHINNKHTCG